MTPDRVVTRAGAVWGQPARLVEELAIGVAEGADEYMLGSVTSVAVGPSARIYVVDGSVPAVRVYDALGDHVMDIGRRGQGPGEFERPTSVGVSADGRVFVRDDGSKGISVYAADGTFVASYPMRGSLMTVEQMVVTPEGIAYSLRDSDHDGGFELVPHGPAAPADGTVFPPRINFVPSVLRAPGPPCGELPVPNAPAYHWSMAYDGRIVAGVSSTYAFRIVGPPGDVLDVERRVKPVEFAPGERDYRRRYAEARFHRACGPGWSWNGPDLPAHKPAYSGLRPVTDGGVWVFRHGPSHRVSDDSCEPEPLRADGRLRPGCWQDTNIVEAFDRGGRFLGQVQLPDSHQREIHGLLYASVLHRDFVVTPETDDAGTVRVKRYRVRTYVGGSAED